MSRLNPKARPFVPGNTTQLGTPADSLQQSVIDAAEGATELMDLPHEMLAAVLARIGPRGQDIISVLSACKHLRGVLREASMELDLTIPVTSRHSSTEAAEILARAVRSIKANLPGITGLSLCNQPVESACVADLLQSLSHLHLLDLSSCKKLAPGVTHLFASSLPISPTAAASTSEGRLFDSTTAAASASEDSHGLAAETNQINLSSDFIGPSDSLPAAAEASAAEIKPASAPTCHHPATLTTLSMQRCYQLNATALTQLLLAAGSPPQPHPCNIAPSPFHSSTAQAAPQSTFSSTPAHSAHDNTVLSSQLPAQLKSTASDPGSNALHSHPFAVASLHNLQCLALSHLDLSAWPLHPNSRSFDLHDGVMHQQQALSEDIPSALLSRVAAAFAAARPRPPLTTPPATGTAAGSAAPPQPWRPPSGHRNRGAGDASTAPALRLPPSLPITQLTVLALHNCSHVHHLSLHTIAVTCPHLQYLLLGGLTLSAHSSPLPILETLATAALGSVENVHNVPADDGGGAGRGAGGSGNIVGRTLLLPPEHASAVLQLASLAQSLPVLQALEMTFVPPAVISGVRRTLDELYYSGGGRAPVQIWDFTSRHSVKAALSALCQSESFVATSPSGSSRSTAAVSPTCHSIRSAGGHFGSTKSPHAASKSLDKEAVDCDAPPAPAALRLALRAAANCSSPRRATPLHIAAAAGDCAAVEALLALGAAPDAREAGGGTPLFLACESGHAAAAAALLRRGANAHIANAAGESPLYISSLRGHLPAVRALLSHFVAAGIPWQDPGLYCDNWTPLMASAVGNRVEVAAALLTAAGPSASPALVHAQNKFGQSALHVAARKGSVALLRLLLAAAGDGGAGCSGGGGGLSGGGRHFSHPVVMADTNGATPMDVAKQHKHVVALAEFRRAITCSAM